MTFKRVRYFIFLRDVAILSVTAFGGPQGHLALFLDMMVKKRGYLSEEDLLELYALCQILPGPTSTQTITALGFKIGGPNLAYLTLLIWVLPAVTIMTIAAIMVVNFQEIDVLNYLRFIQPMAVGIVAYSAYSISSKVVKTNMGFFLMILSAIGSFHMPYPWLLPIFLILGGLATMVKYKRLEKEEDKLGINVKWNNFFLWGGVLIIAALAGGIFQLKSVLIFENFYRNGSLIFGGGQVLVPLLYAEFVEFPKEYLSSEEFISGYGLVQAIPGPVFSFSSYIGALSMRDVGIPGQIAGAFAAAAGIFLPGTFLIFFVIRFWEGLKKYRVVKASLEGVHAVSSGMVIAATFLIFQPIEGTLINYFLMIGTTITLYFTKVPAPLIILGGLILGIVVA